MDQRKTALFLADYDHQAAQIEKIFLLLKDKYVILSKEPVSREMVESAGYWMHNLYCAFEDLFKIVSSFWENNVVGDGRYHHELLRRMILKVNGIRPELLSEKSFQYLNELRGFRHIFRHAYNYGLDDERVIFLLRKMLNQKDIMLSDLKHFRENIEEKVS